MSAVTAAARAKAPAWSPAASAPPLVQRRTAQDFVPPLASLAAIPARPAVQRTCDACEDEKDEMPVQPRLEVGPVGDRFEIEADTIAAKVMAMRDSDATGAAPAVQRACAACASDDEPRARRTSLDKEEEIDEAGSVQARRAGTADATGTIRASHSDLTSGGRPLPPATLDFFEQRMGRDLADVRVHQGGGARDLNESIGARAFTFQNHVWLGSGEGAGPSFTMAHELAHVMQQTAPGAVGPARARRRPLAAAAAGAAPRRKAGKPDRGFVPGVEATGGEPLPAVAAPPADPGTDPPAASDPGAPPAAPAATPTALAVRRGCAACSPSKDEPRAQPLEASADDEEDEAPARRLPFETVLTSDEEDKVRGREAEGESLGASEAELTDGGAPLPAATLGFFEPRMGRDLSNVRVHQGEGAQRFNRSIRARAFTYRNHVWLGSGESASPGFTIAHELAHVLQQTAPGPVGSEPAAEAERDLIAARADGEVIRRKAPTFAPFFMAGEDWNARAVADDRHEKAQAAVAKANHGLITEVPMPGANAKKRETGLCGFADLYKAAGPRTKSTIPGVTKVEGTVADPKDSTVQIEKIGSFRDGDAEGSCVKSPYWGKAKQNGANFPIGPAAAPIYVAGEVKEMDNAPTGITIGEIKPAHNLDYRGEGRDQVRNYIDALGDLRKLTNRHAYKKGGYKQWDPPDAAVMTSVDYPSGWDESGNLTTKWPVKQLKIRDYDVANKNKGRFLFPEASPQALKKGLYKTGISGRWMLAKDTVRYHKGDGVYVYFLAPNPADISKVLKSYKTIDDFKKIAMKINQVYEPLKKPPKTNKVRRRPAQGAPATAGLARPAKPRVSRLAKDEFKRSEWDAIRRGHPDEPGLSKDNLKEQFAKLAPDDVAGTVQAYGLIAKWVREEPYKTDAIKYDSSRADAKKPLEDFTLLRLASFWTSDAATPIGILREKFGGLFVKAFEKFDSLRKRMKKTFKDKPASSYQGGHKGTIREAAAKVAAVVIPKVVAPFMRTMVNTIVDCGVAGFKAKIKAMIEDSPIDQLIDTAEALKDKIDAVAADAEAYFKKLIDDTVGGLQAKIDGFIGDIKTLTEVVGVVAELAKAMRIGACIAGLVSAPETVGIGAVVGCGAALADWILSKFGLSPVEYIIALTLQSCASQNAVGEVVSRLGFMQQMPALAGMKVVELAKKGLTESLTDEIAGKPLGQHAAELFCDLKESDFPTTAFEPITCGGSGSDDGEDDYKRGKGEVTDLPPDLKTFKSGDPIDDKERAQMGEGRSEQVPPATKAPETGGGSPEQAPPAGGESPPADKGGGTEEGDAGGDSSSGSVGRGTITNPGKPISAYIFVHGIEAGFSKGQYEKDVKLSVSVKGKYSVLQGVIRIKVLSMEALDESLWVRFGKTIVNAEYLDNYVIKIGDQQYQLKKGASFIGILGKRRP